MVEAHLVEVGNTKKLALRLTGVYDGPQEVEDGRELQCLSDGTYKLHGTCEELGVEIYDSSLVERAVETVDIAGKLDAMMSNDVRCSTDGGGGIVAVFGHLVSGTGNDKAGGSGDIESILAVATCAYDVNVAVCMNICRQVSRAVICSLGYSL